MIRINARRGGLGRYPSRSLCMSLAHAVVWLDHHHATIQKFDADTVQVQNLKDRQHATRQHGSDVRTVHEFFAEVCGALEGIPEILVLSAHTPQADFKHYVEKHRPALKPKIAGWEIAEHQSDGQALAQARKFFAAHDRMLGKRTS